MLLPLLFDGRNLRVGVEEDAFVRSFHFTFFPSFFVFVFVLFLFSVPSIGLFISIHFLFVCLFVCLLLCSRRSTLRIKCVKEEDAGLYECRASSVLGQGTASKARVTVTKHPSPPRQGKLPPTSITILSFIYWTLMDIHRCGRVDVN